MRIEVELGADDAIGGHNLRQRRLNQLARRRRDHKEREDTAVDAAVEKVDERGNIFPQADSAAGLDQVLPTNAPKFGIVPNQVRQLPSLLDEVTGGQTRDFVLKPRGPE